MNPSPSIIFVFASIHHVLKAEKELEKAGLPFDLIPVPKEVNPDCGMAIETSPDSAEAVEEALQGAGLTVESRYRRVDSRFEPA